jgi:hypothetical protein
LSGSRGSGVGQTGRDPEATVVGAGAKAAAEQRGALVHAEDPVAAIDGLAGSVPARRVGNRQLQLALAVRPSRRLLTDGPLSRDTFARGRFHHQPSARHRLR